MFPGCDHRLERLLKSWDVGPQPEGRTRVQQQDVVCSCCLQLDKCRWPGQCGADNLRYKASQVRYRLAKDDEQTSQVHYRLAKEDEQLSFPDFCDLPTAERAERIKRLELHEALIHEQRLRDEIRASERERAIRIG
jgi:hypothetical protein